MVQTMDKYDVKVPWLTYAEVRDLIARLPLEDVAELAKGPVDDDEECRACDVLEGRWRLAREGGRAAAVLMDWHADLGPSDEFIRIIDKYVGLVDVPKRGRLSDELRDLHGRLAYARCSMMYAMAVNELAVRKATAMPTADFDERERRGGAFEALGLDPAEVS